MIQIAPSILSADFANLGEAVRRLEQAGADIIHIDIMDGHFVPNLTFGPPVIAALRKATALPFDVHLMVTNPQDLIEPFIKAGADIITIHAETAPHLHRLVQSIREIGDVKASVALNPATSLNMLTEILPDLDMVLLMSVNPGFGGQKFLPGTLRKISALREEISKNHLAVDIEVDGGINPFTATQVIAAGANILVAGSAVFGSSDMTEAVQSLRGNYKDKN